MERVKRFALPGLLLLAFLVLLHGNDRVGLFESSEARYAEVAREMVATGDYLSPQMDYVYHFTKPPLTYWITAAGYHLFGVSPFGARFFLAAAAVLILLATAWIYRLKDPGSGGFLAAAALFFCVEFFAMGKVLTTDMYLCLWTTAGFLLWSLMEEGRIGGRASSLLFGIVAALAFMTKGPVAFLIWGSVIVPYALWRREGERLKLLLSPLCWLTFLALAVPWFLAVGLEHPGLLSYLAFRESTEAAYSTQRFHPGPLYYYIPVLLAGFYPWWILLAGGWREVRRAEVRLWLLWATVPVLIWSLFPAKLPTYVLPVFPAWALLAAWAAARPPGPGRPALALFPLASGLLCLGMVAGIWTGAGGVSSPGWPVLAVLVAGGLCGLLGAVAGAVGRKGGAILAASGAILCVQLVIPPLCVSMEDALKIKYRLGAVLKAARQPEEPVLEYKTTLYSIPFYIGDKVAAYGNNFFRNKFVEAPPPHILTDEASLRAFVRENPSLWVVTDPKGEVTLHQLVPGLRPYSRQGYHSLWVSEAVASRLGIAGSQGTDGGKGDGAER